MRKALKKGGDQTIPQRVFTGAQHGQVIAEDHQQHNGHSAQHAQEAGEQGLTAGYPQIVQHQRGKHQNQADAQRDTAAQMALVGAPEVAENGEGGFVAVAAVVKGHFSQRQQGGTEGKDRQAEDDKHQIEKDQGK